ncbi:hypothetical protein [Streptomyces sp. NPDC017988]|uniref:hypothetical protein n=1 Tax=Streptomyces sp. NPDC017988 TaxID=3365025 RepID=UPI0037B39CDC
MHGNRGGRPVDATADDVGPVVERPLTQQQAVHARAVLYYAQAHIPHPKAEAHWQCSCSP